MNGSTLGDFKYFHVNVYVKLQINLVYHMKVHVKVHMKIHLEALANGVRCSDALAAAHCHLAHTVPMKGLRPTTKPNHIFHWD